MSKRLYAPLGIAALFLSLISVFAFSSMPEIITGFNVLSNSSNLTSSVFDSSGISSVVQISYNSSFQNVTNSSAPRNYSGGGGGGGGGSSGSPSPDPAPSPVVNDTNSTIPPSNLTNSTLPVPEVNSTNLTIINSSFEILSSPSGAEIFIDDIYYGLAPVNVTGIAYGEHVIRFAKEGYLDIVVPLYLEDPLPISFSIYGGMTPINISNPPLPPARNSTNDTIIIPPVRNDSNYTIPPVFNGTNRTIPPIEIEPSPSNGTNYTLPPLVIINQTNTTLPPITNQTNSTRPENGTIILPAPGQPSNSTNYTLPPGNYTLPPIEIEPVPPQNLTNYTLPLPVILPPLNLTNTTIPLPGPINLTNSSEQAPVIINITGL